MKKYDGEFDPKKHPNHPDATLVDYVYMGKYKRGIPIGILHSEVRGSLEPAEVGKIVKRLGLDAEYPRVYFEGVGEGGYGGEAETTRLKAKKMKVIPLPDAAKIKELRLRYDLEFIENEINKVQSATVGEGGEGDNANNKEIINQEAGLGGGEGGYGGEAKMVHPPLKILHRIKKLTTPPTDFS